MSMIAQFARDVFDVAARKGMLHVTKDNGSDELVGFFVPAGPMNALGKALARYDEAEAPAQYSSGSFYLEPYDPDITKSITIKGPEDLTLEVDFDDVNHFVVERMIPLVIDYLNAIPAGKMQDVVLAAARAEADEREES